MDISSTYYGHRWTKVTVNILYLVLTEHGFTLLLGRQVSFVFGLQIQSLGLDQECFETHTSGTRDEETREPQDEMSFQIHLTVHAAAADHHVYARSTTHFQLQRFVLC